MEQIFTGALLDDPRPIEEKEKDHSHQEVLGFANPVIWKAKPESEWVSLSLRDQNGSSSCGGHAGAKAIEAIHQLTSSAVPIYRFRSNYPSEGMWIQDIGNILKNKHTCSEANCISMQMSEKQMNDAEIPTDLPYGIDAYYFLPIGQTLDMDLIAQALEKGHPVIVLIRSTYKEWQGVPVVDPTSTNFFGHFITIVPGNYLLHDGEKAVIVDDSWGRATTLGNGGQRILTESYLRARCQGLMAVIPSKPQTRPKYTFTKDLIFGSRGDEVKAFQQVLIWEGFLQKGYDTGYFGPLTLKGAMKWQEKNREKILIPAGLGSPSGKILKYSRAVLNEIYS